MNLVKLEECADNNLKDFFICNHTNENKNATFYRLCLESNLGNVNLTQGFVTLPCSVT